jgi:glutamate 5-kinase
MICERSAHTDRLLLGILPIVNENDTVITEGCTGDNDRLRAVAGKIQSDLLILLTDVEWF